MPSGADVAKDFLVMTIIPNQFFGHGDIHFTITLAKIIADGRPIVWPVLPQFVDGFTRGFPDIKFIDWRTLQIDYERRDQYECTVQGLGKCNVLPFRWAVENMGLPYTDCMRAKYMMYGLDWQIWKEQAMWVRDTEQEIKLWNGVNAGKHIFINNTFGSDCKLHIELPDFFGNVVTLGVSVHYSLFDWVKIIEQATEIHTVSTSIIYLLEMLDLTAKEVHLYPRKPIETDFRNVDYILQKHKYILHA